MYSCSLLKSIIYPSQEFINLFTTFTHPLSVDGPPGQGRRDSARTDAEFEHSCAGFELPLLDNQAEHRFRHWFRHGPRSIIKIGCSVEIDANCLSRLVRDLQGEGASFAHLAFHLDISSQVLHDAV